MSFIDAAVTAANPQGTPRTYPQILAAIDAEQVVVVTGEEDNEFDPKTHRAWVPPASAAPPVSTSSPAPAPAPAPPERFVSSQDTGAPRASGCAMGGAPVDGAWGALLLAVAGILTSLRRRQLR
jgi:MYXO-CTERM domain-containing protein